MRLNASDILHSANPNVVQLYNIDNSLDLKSNIDNPTFTTNITTPKIHVSEIMSQNSHLKIGSSHTNDINLFLNNAETLQLTRTGTECRYQAHGGTGQHRFMNKIYCNGDVDIASGGKYRINGTELDRADVGLSNVLNVASYSKAETDTEIANLVNSAPENLNTLNELASALNDDQNFATTITNSVSLKAPIDNPTFTTNITTPKIHVSEIMSQNSHLKIGSSHTNDLNIFLNNAETLQMTRNGTECRYQSHGGSGQHRFMNKIYCNDDVDIASGKKYKINGTDIRETSLAYLEVDATGSPVRFRDSADTTVVLHTYTINALRGCLKVELSHDWIKSAQGDQGILIQNSLLTDLSIVKHLSATLKTDDTDFRGFQNVSNMIINVNSGSENGILVWLKHKDPLQFGGGSDATLDAGSQFWIFFEIQNVTLY